MKESMEIVDAGEVIGRIGERAIHAWIQTRDGLRWKYAGLAVKRKLRDDECALDGLRYRSLYGDRRYFWVGVLDGQVATIHSNGGYPGIGYTEFRNNLEEFIGGTSAPGFNLVLLPREEAFSLPTVFGA